MSSPRKLLAERRLPLAWFLEAVIGLAMLISLGLVLWLTLSTARENTMDLLHDKARLVLTLVRTRIDQFLEPAEALTAEVAMRIARGEIDPSTDASLFNALHYALAGAPQLNAVAYADADGRLVTVFREEDGGIGSASQTWVDDPVTSRAVAAILGVEDPRPGWGEPIYIGDAGTTLVLFSHPVHRDGTLIGLVSATTTVTNLSAFLASFETPQEIGTFILYGEDRVIAHPRLLELEELVTADNPLPTLDQLGVAPLAAIWADGWAERRLEEMDIDGHWYNGAAGEFVYLYERIDDARATPWIVGGYFDADEIGREWYRLRVAAGIALGLVALSILGAFLIARSLAKPATTIAATARAISDLDLDRLEPLPGSRIAEIDDAERALNGAVAALRSFNRYLPKDLVNYVLHHPGVDIGRPRLQPMTVMFTDITGFTSLAERLDPEAAGALLNAHFADLEAAIRATQGNIDKFMGDGLLAYWGAPEPLPDHAARAIAAAQAMAEAVRVRNRTAETPLRLRIGVATGSILVGDLGAPNRLNYTVIGDSVNIAQRLQDLAHDLVPEHETVIITTGVCIEAILLPPPVRPLGRHPVRGRQGQVEVFEVLPASADR